MENGFMLIYAKDNKAHAVVMSNEQYNTLQALIPAIFGNETIQVIESDMGDVYNMADKKREINGANGIV